MAPVCGDADTITVLDPFWHADELTDTISDSESNTVADVVTHSVTFSNTITDLGPFCHTDELTDTISDSDSNPVANVVTHAVVFSDTICIVFSFALHLTTSDRFLFIRSKFATHSG